MSSGNDQTDSPLAVGVVVIGRNEGDRLIRALGSIQAAQLAVYVDSGSSDGSLVLAQGLGIPTIALDNAQPFSAARARNEGYKALQERAGKIDFVQFLDGDCELSPGWIETASVFLSEHSEAGIVRGALHERNPHSSVYNWLCQQDWDGPTGKVRATGGIVLIRCEAFETAGGYREDIIAAEDDELCIRIRKAGWDIWRIDASMAVHDADMTRFSQWWRRSVRTGYAYAQVGYLHRASGERYFVWESIRAWVWGVILPTVIFITNITLARWTFALWLVYPLNFFQKILRSQRPFPEKLITAFFDVLSMFPQALGQIRFARDAAFTRRARIIEYK